MDQYIGKMLDNRYEILEVIGSGGMAVVYKAKCHRLNRMVAVKILRSELTEDADFRRRFRDESQAVAMLSHPNIVSVYDVSRGGDTEYIVMELIDGITLKQYMEKRGQLKWVEALHFITQIMRGLSHAHSRGIVHRDIKPQNIMVLRDGSVKIADFGIACLSNSANTLTQEALGSVHYISPEQARGERVTARSDIYSAGVVLYEMLTSRLPFEGDSAVAVALQHLSSIPLSPREVNPDIPESLELICMKAMAPDADRRYQSADEMIAALEEFRKNPDVKMDFSMKDLHPAEPDDPTSPLPVAEVNHISRTVRKQSASRLPEDDDGDDDDSIRSVKRRGKKHNVLMIAGLVVLALVLLLGVGKVLMSSLSGGSGMMEVPNLIGMTLDEAKSDERIQGIFEIEVIGNRVSDRYEVGQIVEQDPGKGAWKKPGAVIEVFLSSGDGSQEMPDLIGEDYQASHVLLSNMNLGLKVEKDEVYHPTIEAGKIVSTIPDAGEALNEGNTVYIVVSKGPEPVPVTVVSFLGQTEAEAKRNAEALGLVVGASSSRESNEPEGTVIEQSIQPGDTVDSGTEISFVISEGPPPSSVTKRYTLPFWQSDQIHVVIEFDGEEVYNETVSTMMGYVEYTFTGKGSGHQVRVYFDDVLNYDEEINFH
ncbi:MAG: Stk1 family PASTA domain-containing Ser/Thr kinase [Oscillospiraceae bacterium]